MNDALAALSKAGVSIWLDDLSRERLVSGSLADLAARDHVVGVTTNPSIFAKAITGSDAYDAQLRDLAARGVDVRTALRALTTFDVRWACDVLRPVYDGTVGWTAGIDRGGPAARPRHAATIAEARALWWLVDRPNLFVKIPAARQGIPAISACLAEGISINVTLIFSMQRYDAVMDAFLDGMERARQAGLDLSPIASVASFFVSRVDTEIDSRLDKIGTSEAAALRGRAAIANARLAYQHYEKVFAGPRWAALRDAGARPQRPLWASTSVKDPAYPDTRYVTDLVAPGVVNTMPEATLRLVADHGQVPADSVHGHYDESQQVLASCRNSASTTTTWCSASRTTAWPLRQRLGTARPATGRHPAGPASSATAGPVAGGLTNAHHARCLQRTYRPAASAQSGCRWRGPVPRQPSAARPQGCRSGRRQGADGSWGRARDRL